MQTLQLTITLPDIIQFDDRAALQMQVLYVKSLVDAGKIDFTDPAQRDAVLEWYLKIVPHIQPTAEENEAARADFRRSYGLLEVENQSPQERWAQWQKVAVEIDRHAEDQGKTA